MITHELFFSSDTTAEMAALFAASAPLDIAAFFIKELAFVGAVYVMGAAICRLRLAGIKPRWIALYTAVFASACWYNHALIYESVTMRDVLTSVMVAAYVFMTRNSWSDGVPEIARRT